MGVIFHEMGKRLPVAPSFTEVVFRVKTFPMVEHDPIDSIWFCSVEVRDTPIKCTPGEQKPCYFRTKFKQATFPNASEHFPSFFYPKLQRGLSHSHRSFRTYDTGVACRALQSDLNHAIELYNERLVDWITPQIR
jgi:hypothetical protein